MRYLPHTDAEIRRMLETIGVRSVEELFEKAIPESLRTERPLELPAAMSEPELMAHVEELAARDLCAGPLSFLGAGSYHHHVPPTVGALVSRGEFLTAYTPYQSEASQGTLQAIFEFQTLVCQLLVMEVANASMYDGASAAAEAVLMARRASKGSRTKALVSRGLHPHYRAVIQTYLRGMDCASCYAEVDLAPDGGMSVEALRALLDEETAVVLVGYPNYFGVIEDLPAIVAAADPVGVPVCTVTAEPVALGVVEAPGMLGASIAVAEGQALGVPPSFGGPGVGLFGCAERFMRQMPGRLVGETVDRDGRRAFVLTLATREQHIRREKATSNICTNQGLIALAVTVYLSLLGREGFESLARLCLSKATYLKRAIAATDDYELAFDGPTFNELLLRKKGGGVEEMLSTLAAEGLLAGVSVGRDYPDLDDCFLVAVTERHRREDLDRLVDALTEA